MSETDDKTLTGGYCRFARGWLEHEVWRAQKFSRRDAWAWLIFEAAFRDHERDINGKIVQLKRGQLAHSIRFIGEAWRWDKAAVSRYIKRLKTERMIETATETGLTIITICNYDKYQATAPDPETPTETANETKARQHRDRREDSTPDGVVDTENPNNKKEALELKKLDLPEQRPKDDLIDQNLGDDTPVWDGADPRDDANGRGPNRDAAFRQIDGPDYRVEQNRIDRHRQKVFAHAIITMSRDDSKAWMTDYISNEPRAVAHFEVLSRQLKAEERARGASNDGPRA